MLSLPIIRPVTARDEPFLFQLYASTRAEELAAWNWSPLQRETFLRMQWLAQKRDYESRYPTEDHCIIELKHERVGRLWSVRTEHEMRLVDIALLPEHRGTGMGTMLVRALQVEAAVARKPVRLHVVRDNPALRLYQRLGFVPSGGEGETADQPYVELEWRASPSR